MKQNTGVTIAVILALTAAALAGYAVYRSGQSTNSGAQAPVTQSTPVPQSTPAPTAGEEVGGDRDAHGCIGSAGYTWCEEKGKCLRTWEEPCTGPTPDETEALKTAIRDAVAAQTKTPPEEISVTVSKISGDFASGGVGPVTPGPGGGMWFAARTNGTWKLVWGGNGMISCADLADYPNYPTDMIPECYDLKTGSMVKR